MLGLCCSVIPNMRFLILFFVNLSPHWCSYFQSNIAASANPNEPIFDTSPRNVTAIAGETINLPCAVHNKDNFNLIWMNPRVTLISRDESRFIDDSRISVERPKTKDWNLMIREVRYNDSGEYMCQINTQPIKIKRIYLYVKVPPEFIEDGSDTHFNVEEGSTITLSCNATGVPMPVVTWYKQSKLLTDYSENENGKETTLIGELMILRNVSRYCDGKYECNAENGVPPLATRQFTVTVLFKPEVTLNTHRMSQSLGKETILECKVSASPHALITWTRNNEPIPYGRSKYRDELYGADGSTEKTLALQIIDLERHDFGNYTCRASNPLGEDSETMHLYEFEPPKPPPRLFTRPWQPSPRPTGHRAYYPDFITSPIYAGSRHNNRGNGVYNNFRSNAQESMTSNTYFRLLGIMTMAISCMFYQKYNFA